MEPTTINDAPYYLPGSINDVQWLIKTARQKKTQIRVCGSLHSVKAAIYPNQQPSGNEPAITVILSKMNAVSINQAENMVTVEAGCHLGYDPVDITQTSTWENSLFAQLDAAGYAVPDMGGIILQTVGGFLSTGSSGGSTQYSFNESLVGLTFIPADSDDPQPVSVSVTDSNTDLFYALGVSMGLLGIIVSATFSLVKKFNVTGNELTTSIANSAIDMTGTGVAGKVSMQQFLTTTEYARILWYPQPGVTRATVWQARQMQEGEPFTRKPYVELPTIAGSELPAEIAIDLVYSAIGKWPVWLEKMIGLNNPLYKVLTDYVNKNFYTSENGIAIFPAILNLFVKENVTQLFQDYWYSSLPMDNNVNYKLFPVEFTEMWIPFDQNSKEDTVAAVLQAMNQLFDEMYANGNGPIPDGDFCTELYAAKSSKFWMSPSYGSDVFRVDVFWFGNNAGSPADRFYPQFWKALSRFNYRCHWGKYLPAAESEQGADYLKKQYPRFEDFLLLRSKYDPQQIFVNDHWRKHLQIPALS